MSACFHRFVCSVCIFSAIVLAGCVTTKPTMISEEPDFSVSGVTGWGEVSGDRTSQIKSTIEAIAFKKLPNLQWADGKSDSLDVLIDLQVFTANTRDISSSEEQRTCRRWSDPDPNAKGFFQKLISRKCLDWQTAQVACLTRVYVADAQVKVRRKSDQRILISDRKVEEASERSCGGDQPSAIQLQLKAESQLAEWAVSRLRGTSGGWASGKAVSTASLSVNQPVVSLETSNSTGKGAEDKKTRDDIDLVLAEEHNAKRKQAELEAQLAAVQQAQVRPVAPAGPTLSVHAIVIGNGAYQGSGRLENPINDARAISAKLKRMGFKVTTVENADRNKLVSSLVKFSSSAAESDLTLFFYAGHGVQISGTNYMLPTDTNLNQIGGVPLHGISLNSVVDQFLPGKTKLVFLDACRDNPLLQVASRSVSRGLAPISVSQGTLISYATKDGSVAADGEGKNSPFTKALLQHIDSPEDIAVVLRKVRDQVMRDTGGQQQPWEYGSLSGGSLILSAIRAK